MFAEYLKSNFISTEHLFLSFLMVRPPLMDLGIEDVKGCGVRFVEASPPRRPTQTARSRPKERCVTTTTNQGLAHQE